MPIGCDLQDQDVYRVEVTSQYFEDWQRKVTEGQKEMQSPPTGLPRAQFHLYPQFVALKIGIHF